MRSWVQKVLQSVTIAHSTAAAYSHEFEMGRFETLLVSMDVTLALTGGSTPGVMFTLEVDPGNAQWVAASTLIATTKGFAANAVADLTLTATGRDYRYYPVIAGYRGRVKYEITGTPTGGSGAINRIDVLLTGGGR